MENKDELIELYSSQKIQGRYLSEIRKELLQKGFSEDEVKLIIRKIDEKVLQHELDKTKAKINKQILYFGTFLTVLGIALYLLSRLDIMKMKNDLVIYTTAFIAGLVMVVYSLAFSNKPKWRK